jgi:D-inositol-3-phosphate glycosyltransferase
VINRRAPRVHSGRDSLQLRNAPNLHVKQRIAILAHDLKGGGVGTLTAYLHQALLASDKFHPSIISLATSRSDTSSVRIVSPSTWWRGVKTESVVWRGIPVQHVGAHAVELEFQRYRPRLALDRLLKDFALIQFVVGSAPWVCTALHLPQPKMVWAATTTRADRASQTRKLPFVRRAWASLMIARAESAEKRGLAGAATVFALSPYTAREVAKLAPRARIVLAPCGVDTSVFRPSSEPLNGYLLSVGRVSDARKNAPLLLESYARLRQRLPKCPELWFVGDPPSPRMSLEAESKGQLAGVRFLGRVGLEELPSLYRGAMLFVLASDEEGLGMVILEAMASGLPVVSTKCGGPDAIVVEGRTGFLVPVRDAGALSEALEKLVRCEEQRRQMGRSGRKAAEDHFSAQKTMKVFLSEYERALLH